MDPSNVDKRAEGEHIEKPCGRLTMTIPPMTRWKRRTRSSRRRRRNRWKREDSRHPGVFRFTQQEQKNNQREKKECRGESPAWDTYLSLSSFRNA